jgi:hypothetical protein
VECRWLSPGICQFKGTVDAAMDSEEALEQVVLAPVQCVIPGDDVHLVSLPDRHVFRVVAVQAERPEVVGEVIGKECPAQIIVLSWPFAA